MQVRRRLLLLGTIVLVAGMLPTAASAVTLVAPGEGQTTGSQPIFAWALAPGEAAFSLEFSPNPLPGAGGGFADDVEKRQESLLDTQTAFVVGNRQPLSPGVWYWHLATFANEFDLRFSPIRRFVVRDERIRLQSFKLTQFGCIPQVTVEFAYTDNSVGLPARYRVEFRKRRRGRTIASIRGRAEDGRLFRSARLPRKVRRGRYFARLSIRDAGRHVDRSPFRRLRVGRC